MADIPTIHCFTSSEVGALVNAYLVETPNGVVAVDSMLTVSDGMRLRGELEKLGKPLLAVLLTQSHPDHYGGLAQLVPDDETPIIAPRGVHYVTRRDDPVKEQILRPMYGEDWAVERKFPNTVIRDSETVTFDGVDFTAIDLGPSESPHDSPWILGQGERSGSGTSSGCAPASPATRPSTSGTAGRAAVATGTGSAATSRPS